VPLGAADVIDLLAIPDMRGPCALVSPGDVDADGSIGVSDLLAVLQAWGARE